VSADSYLHIFKQNFSFFSEDTFLQHYRASCIIKKYSLWLF
jgi:hypothetical protein